MLSLLYSEYLTFQLMIENMLSPENQSIFSLGSDVYMVGMFGFEPSLITLNENREYIKDYTALRFEFAEQHCGPLFWMLCFLSMENRESNEGKIGGQARYTSSYILAWFSCKHHSIYYVCKPGARLLVSKNDNMFL